MTSLKVFVISAIAGAGLTLGAGIIIGWIILIRSWIHPIITQSLPIYF